MLGFLAIVSGLVPWVILTVIANVFGQTYDALTAMEHIMISCIVALFYVLEKIQKSLDESSKGIKD